MVPIVSAPRPYVLVPAAAGGAPWTGSRAATPLETGSGPSAPAPPPHAPARKEAAAAAPPPYDPWAEPATSLDPAGDIPRRSVEGSGGRAGSPLLPALLAVVGALVGYWAGTQGFLSGLPVVSLAGPAGLAVLGASVGLLAGWAGDRWTAGR